MSELMATAHADWRKKGQLIAMTIALNGDQSLAFDLSGVLARLDAHWAKEFGDVYDDQIEGLFRELNPALLSENNNVVKFPGGDV